MRLGLGIDLVTRRCGVAAAAAATIRDNITTGATVYEARISEAQTNTVADFSKVNTEMLSSADTVFDLAEGEIASMSIWVYAADWSAASDTNGHIMGNSPNAYSPDSYSIIYNTGSDAFRSFIEDADTQIVTTIGTAVNATWHHIVKVTNRSTNLINCWLDGTQVITDLDISTITGAIDTADFHIGAIGTGQEVTFNACSAGFWKGTALDQTAVTALYNAGTPLTAAQVAADDAIPAATAYWNLDELSGTRADSVASYDLTDNNTVASAAGPTGWYHQAATGHVIGRIPLYNLADTLVDYLTDAGTHANRAVFDLDDAAANNEASIDSSAGGSSYDYTFAGALAQSNYIFAVVKADASNTSRVIFDGDVASKQLLSHNTSGTKLLISAGSALLSGTDHGTTLRLHTVLYNGASSQLWLDGTSDATGDAGAQNLTGVTLMSLNDQTLPWEGKVMEFWVISAVDDRAAIDTLLKTKFGI